jgi:P-type E1-E2 ATPase
VVSAVAVVFVTAGTTVVLGAVTAGMTTGADEVVATVLVAVTVRVTTGATVFVTVVLVCVELTARAGFLVVLALAGVIVMADELRPDAVHIVERLRGEGVRHVAMVSGDRRSVAERIGLELGVDRVYSEQSPEDKLEVVTSLRADHNLSPVIMVGDGVNDAPALALADLARRAGGRRVGAKHHVAGAR